MSIVRVGLSETKKFAEGFEAIFGNKKKPATKKKTTASAKGANAKKKKATKKKA